MPEENRPDPETEQAQAASTGELVVAVLESDDEDRKARRHALGRLAVRLAGGARAAGAKSVAGGQWLTGVLADDVAPRIPIRDAATLRAHHPGLDADERAQALIRTATATTATVGAAGGAAAAVKMTAPPLLLTAPALLSAETLTVATVEVKLLAELHENYESPAPGGPVQRTSGYVLSWVHRRGLDSLNEDLLGATLSLAARTALRNRLMRLMGRHLSTFGPYLTGAVAGGAINRTGTKRLAEAVCADLRTGGTARDGGTAALDPGSPALPPNR